MRKLDRGALWFVADQAGIVAGIHVFSCNFAYLGTLYLASFVTTVPILGCTPFRELLYRGKAVVVTGAPDCSAVVIVRAGSEHHDKQTPNLSEHSWLPFGCLISDGIRFWHRPDLGLGFATRY